MSHSSGDTYRSISSPVQGLYKEKGSRFIALAYPIHSEEEVQPILDDIRRSYHDARHHCYAWRLGISGEHYRVNDDGEPSGSAGKPILGQMLSMEISDLLVVVVRYFGGVKLGVGGLVQAYKSATRSALEEARICTRELRTRFRIDFDYPRMNDVMRFVRETGLDIESTDFSITCSLIAGIRNSHAPSVEEKAEGFYGMSCKAIGQFIYDPK